MTSSTEQWFTDLLGAGGHTQNSEDLLTALIISASSTYKGQCQLRQLILQDSVPDVMPHWNESELNEKVQYLQWCKFPSYPSPLSPPPLPPPPPPLPPPLPPQESGVLDILLGRLLNAGWVSQARELATSMQHNSPDLTIVLVRLTISSLIPPLF